MICSEVTFQTSVGSEKEDPVFQRGAVFIYAYQAVTSESESKVRLFSPFPQPPAFDPAGALRLRQIVLEARQNLSNTGQKYQDHIDPTTGKCYSTPMYCVVNTNDMLAKLAGLAESIEYRVNLLLKEQEAIADDTQATTAFLYLTEDEFSALSELAKEVLARRKVATCPTINASTEQPLLYPDVAHTYSTPNA